MDAPRDDFIEKTSDSLAIVGLRQRGEMLHPRPQRRKVLARLAQPEDVRVSGRLERRARLPQGFAQFLARADPGEDDFDVPAQLPAPKGGFKSSARPTIRTCLPMFSTKTSRLCQTRSLQHQVHRFRDGHEEAFHIGVRNGERAASGNLPFEARNDAAAAAQHVAKAHHRKQFARPPRGLQHQQFGKPLGSAIDVGRATALSVEIRTKRSTPKRSETSTTFFVPSTLLVTASAGLASISGTCLCAAAWTHHLRAAFRKDGFQPAAVAHIGNQRLNFQMRKVFAQFEQGLEDGAFAMPQQEQPRGIPAADLTAQLPPNGPPAPVTRTVLPASVSPMDSSYRRTGSRRSRSVISTSRTGG